LRPGLACISRQLAAAGRDHRIFATFLAFGGGACSVRSIELTSCRKSSDADSTRRPIPPRATDTSRAGTVYLRAMLASSSISARPGGRSFTRTLSPGGGEAEVWTKSPIQERSRTIPGCRRSPITSSQVSRCLPRSALRRSISRWGIGDIPADLDPNGEPPRSPPRFGGFVRSHFPRGIPGRSGTGGELRDVRVETF
jgi:hypothetical protein